MTAHNAATYIRHLYRQVMREHEICERIRTSQIFTQHVISKICREDAGSLSMHCMNRRRKGRVARAYIVNDDPYFERVNRFDGGRECFA